MYCLDVYLSTLVFGVQESNRPVFSRIVRDIRCIMSHGEVSRYVVEKRPELAKAWLQWLSNILRLRGPDEYDFIEYVPMSSYSHFNIFVLVVGF